MTYITHITQFQWPALCVIQLISPSLSPPGAINMAPWNPDETSGIKMDDLPVSSPWSA